VNGKSLFKKSKTDFYQLLIDHAQKVHEANELLVKYLSEEDEEAPKRIFYLEREADDLRRILIEKLNNTLITPFDREDIFALSRAVDDIIDAAKRTVEEIIIFKIKPNEDLLEKVKVLEKGSLEIFDSLKNMKNHPAVSLEHAKQAKATENQMNHIYLKTLADLFNSPENSAGYMLKMREIYRHLNRSADRCDDAANIISDIIIKTA
jgi:predicted phosphate transport protein (TIGR00153 family)